MSVLAIIAALVIEQWQPLGERKAVQGVLAGWAAWLEQQFNGGERRHGIVAWLVAVLPWVAAAIALHLLLHSASPLLALVFNIAVLYLTLGFRQFSHYFTDIREALERGDEDQARRLLAEWRHLDASELPRTELLRHVIEHSLLAAHRHVFGVFFWFVVLSTLSLGPAGAVLYRMAEFASRYWAFKSRALEAPTNERLMTLSQRCFGVIDHLPARLTAFGFAVVGNFEEAINGWRRDAALWRHDNEGVILASAAGAVGVQLGGAAAPGVTPDRSKTFETGVPPEMAGSSASTPGIPPQFGHLQSVVGLVWRSVVLWMLLLALLSLANLVG
jgi:adenosylcobinamide-phosphate synthase